MRNGSQENTNISPNINGSIVADNNVQFNGRKEEPKLVQSNMFVVNAIKDWCYILSMFIMIMLTNVFNQFNMSIL